MARSAFYKPASRWQSFVSLAAAIALEAGAVAVASLHEREEIPTVTGAPRPIEGVLADLPPEPTPPSEETPPPLPPTPIEPGDFVIQAPTPPPRAQKAPHPRIRGDALRTPGAVTGPVNLSSTQDNMLSSPPPSYSYEARRARQTGSGKFLLRFDANGSVIDVRMVESTGSGILDQLSMNTFRRWRCKPGIYKQVYVPITFTLEGAQL